MLSLCIRDMLLIKNHWKLILGYPIFALLVFSKLNASPYVIGAFMIVYLMNQYYFYYDEKNKSEKIFVSFPFRRKTIVQSRYLSLIISCLVAFILMAIAGLIAINFDVFQLQRWVKAIDMVQLLLMTAIFGGLSLPLYLRFGYSKMRAINIIIFFIIFFIPSIINGLINEVSHPIIETLKNILIKVSSYNGMFMSVLFSICILLVSMLIASSFYERREF